MKMPLSTEVDLSPGHIVLDGDPAAPAKGAQQRPLCGCMSIVVATVAHLSYCWALVRKLWAVLYMCRHNLHGQRHAAKWGAGYNGINVTPVDFRDMFLCDKTSHCHASVKLWNRSRLRLQLPSIHTIVHRSRPLLHDPLSSPISHHCVWSGTGPDSRDSPQRSL